MISSAQNKEESGMKRCNSHQYIPPTRKLINMKNQKLKWQKEAAEKDKERESLLGMRKLNTSLFQTRMNSSMLVSPDQREDDMNSSMLIGKSSTSILNSPSSNRPVVRYFGHTESELETSKA